MYLDREEDELAKQARAIQLDVEEFDDADASADEDGSVEASLTPKDSGTAKRVFGVRFG
jgi:hypothetical protein